MKELQTYDAIIFGGGPAGISCALEFHECKVNYILVDRNPRLGGQLSEVQNSIRNFAARFWESGLALRDDMEALCHKIGIVPQLSETISKVDLSNKMLYGSKHTYKGKAIFLATGRRPRMLSIQGADLVKESIILYVEENEKRLAGKSIAVVGGGDNALMDCLWLAQRCPSVLLINHSDHFKARPDVVANVLKNPRVKVMNHTEIISVAGEHGKLHNIITKNNLSEEIITHQADYLVIKAGFAANSELFSSQLKMDNTGLVIIDQSCKTSVQGIFAGGDLVAPDCLGIARSVGHGLVAARAISQYLIHPG